MSTPRNPCVVSGAKAILKQNKKKAYVDTRLHQIDPVAYWRFCSSQVAEDEELYSMLYVLDLGTYILKLGYAFSTGLQLGVGAYRPGADMGPSAPHRPR